MSVWPEAYDLRIYDEIDSTLAEAARIAPGVSRPVWMLARLQTAARARRGRNWDSPRGNLYSTLVYNPGCGPQQAALRSFVAALALFDACVAVIGRAEGLALKWPNDVLLNGGKLAGILLESLSLGPDRLYLAVGIGVNLADAPPVEAVEPGAVRPVSLAGETGVLITPDDFLIELALAYDRYEAQLSTEGFAPIRSAWLARAARLGEQIVARTGTSETVGIFETIDTDGQLVLSTASGRVRIPAADVYF
ncbi:biotin--[acetyl-CoA-carboxylase] ligase [Pseudodonghicola flavimaris]|uniref:biotin--[biotin carboxyl-carrier protein] ligase n=1 Tax=Pseudodonghicola flavimaris TaxID=3050036 RepID=A0ABT7EV32_9RHOB|nr:biotin--[acetyl-CoA-carboxylase] ligase [Pseudodonghicola flavimaris]MDK3016209.1 biotin--[acetyl-CoA-carboxylase] ligase [Pseudodonghicola flavimaris]